MVKITKATFGDEFDSTDVMKSLNDKFKDGAIDVYVDSSIIPLVDSVSGAKTTTLTPEEKGDIKETVAQMCGPNDQVCMEVKSQELIKSKLAEKDAAKTSSTTQVIKGRRLTVEYTDDAGVKHTAVIPEGQQFQLGDLGKKPGATPPITKPSAAEQIFKSWWAILGSTILMFLWTASIVITWMTYVKYGSKLLAAGMTAIAVFIPYSGFGLSFFGPFITEFFRVEKVKRAEVEALSSMTGGRILSGRK